MCDRWKYSFENFKIDMYDSYIEHVNKFGESDTTIERNDVSKNYYKENCKWITRREQAQNKSTSHWITYNGITHNLTEWANIIGIKPRTLSCRLNDYGWSIERALTTPVTPRTKLVKKKKE